VLPLKETSKPDLTQTNYKNPRYQTTWMLNVETGQIFTVLAAAFNVFIPSMMV